MIISSSDGTSYRKLRNSVFIVRINVITGREESENDHHINREATRGVGFICIVYLQVMRVTL